MNPKFKIGICLASGMLIVACAGQTQYIKGETALNGFNQTGQVKQEPLKVLAKITLYKNLKPITADFGIAIIPQKKIAMDIYGPMGLRIANLYLVKDSILVWINHTDKNMYIKAYKPGDAGIEIKNMDIFTLFDLLWQERELDDKSGDIERHQKEKTFLKRIILEWESKPLLEIVTKKRTAKPVWKNNPFHVNLPLNYAILNNSTGSSADSLTYEKFSIEDLLGE